MNLRQLGYVPQPLPTDGDGFAKTRGHWPAALLTAPHVIHAGTRDFCRRVRDRVETLLVDPKTAAYQFEGYMSMEEARAVPYSPGRTTLGSLWQAREFESAAARERLVDAVFELQVGAGADLPLAPYFAIPRVDHPWLEIAAATAADALERASGPAGLVVQVELDALPGDGVRRVLEAFAGLRPALVILIVTDFDERLASPAETASVLALLAGFAASGAPVLPAYCGRFGLLAIAHGACGYAGGGLELEGHPKRFLREGLINLKGSAHYLPPAMVRLPVLEAQALVDAVPEACGQPPLAPARTVHRDRVAAAFSAKRGEAQALLAAHSPVENLERQLAAALALCRRGQSALAGSRTPIPNGQFHYLEVLRELCGGPAAAIPGDAGI